MYRHPEKFGLSPHASDEGKVLDIRIGRKMDDAYLKIQQRFISELLRIEFLPFMPEGSPIPSGYWKFLDYGHAYYPMRGNALRKNLFRKRWNASRTLLALESHQILDRMFAVSPYLRIHEIFGGFKIRDGGTFSEIEASSEETKFIRGFQSGKKLSENLLSHPLSAPFETVRKFIAAGILYETP